MSKSKSHHVIAGRLRSECSSSTFNHQASLIQLVGLVDSIAADFLAAPGLMQFFFARGIIKWKKKQLLRTMMDGQILFRFCS